LWCPAPLVKEFSSVSIVDGSERRAKRNPAWDTGFGEFRQ
jgi:hypothetical protein